MTERSTRSASSRISPSRSFPTSTPRAEAEGARDRFEAVFARGTVPDEMPSFTASSPMRMLDLLTSSGLARSRGEGRRLLSQGAVSLDGERVLQDVAVAAPADGAVLKVGKRRFLRVVPAPITGALDVVAGPGIPWQPDLRRGSDSQHCLDPVRV